MNPIKLVGIIKTIVTEANHSSRYRRQKKNLSVVDVNKPDKTPQLAETKKIKIKKTGKTETGQVANKIITEPELGSQMSPTQGSKPSIDTK